MKKILVIEDNVEVRENLCEILSLANYRTEEAENGKEGLEKIKSEHPDLILCDVMMPILDGFGVLRILNRDPLLMHIPFMFLTAKADKSDFRKGMGLGADDYITKPFDEVELLDAIEIRLKKSHLISKIENTEDGMRTFFSEAKAQSAIEELSENRDKRKYQKNSIIYEEKQYPKYLYFVISGSVKSTQIADNGKELMINIYSHGDFVGLLSLIDESPYKETATCNEDTTVLLIPKEDFKKALFNNRDFSAKLFKMLAHHASHTQSQLLDLAFSSVRKRVAKSILIYSKKKNSTEINVSREELAAMAGTSRESVIRTLTDFKEEGLIQSDRSSLTIINKSKLERLPQ